MKYVLAISGGVDSVVLLDQFARAKKDFVVAHFDHGIRENSSRDAEFVRKLCEKYNVKFVCEKANLGAKSSEDLARQKRYEFLRKTAKTEKSDQIVTAHHQDDLIETIVMNLIRGTGWRGLAPMWSPDISRPFLAKSKAEIVDYALQNNLVWAEDETNYTPDYFRNRVRNVVAKMSGANRRKLVQICQKQNELRREIENEIAKFSQPEICRYDLIMWPQNVALEILRGATNATLTRPQISQILLFAKTAKSGKSLYFGASVKITAKKDAIYVRTS